MSKYQEALDIIVEKTDMLNNTCLHLPKCMKNGICHYAGEGLCEDYERAKLLQELVDKETPMKVLILKKQYEVETEMYRNYGDCPKCNHSNLIGQCRCDECGQKLDFGGE